MKNHVINYKKYITLATVLAMTMVGVATVPNLVNNTQYDVIDVDTGNVIYRMDDSINVNNPSIINEWNDFDNGNVPFNTGYTSYPYEVSGNTAKSIASAENTLDEVDYSQLIIPNEQLDKVAEKNISGESGNITIQEFLAKDSWGLSTLNYFVSSGGSDELLKPKTVQLQLQMVGDFKKGETYSYKLTEETFNKLPNKELSLPKTIQIEGWSDLNGDYDTQATLTLDKTGVLTIKFDENSWFSDNSDLSQYYFVVPFLERDPVRNATESIKIPYISEKYEAMKDLPALFLYNMIKEDIPYYSYNINGTQFNTFEHEIKLIENNLNRNKVGKYKQVYEVTTLNDKKGYKTLEIEVTPTSKVELEASNLKVAAAKRVFNPLDEVEYDAIDERDGLINDKVEVVESNVNIEVAGIYSLRLAVVNSEGSEATDEISVIVEEPETPEVEEPETPETPETTEKEEEEPIKEPEIAEEKPVVEEPKVEKEKEEIKVVEKVEVPNDPKTEEVKEPKTTKEQPEKETLEVEKEVQEVQKVQKVEKETPKVETKDAPSTLLQTDITSLNTAAKGFIGLFTAANGLYMFKIRKK